jgi:hypothetical protein
VMVRHYVKNVFTVGTVGWNLFLVIKHYGDGDG